MPVLHYQADWALQFNELSILVGIKNCSQHDSVFGFGLVLDTMQSDYPILPITVPLGSGSSSGIVFGLKQLDDWVELGISLVKIGSPFSELINSVVVHMFGNINGKHCIPLNQQGDGMFHIAFFPVPNAEIEENIEVMRETLVPLATSKDYTEL